MTGVVSIDDREYDFSQTYALLLELFKYIDAAQQGVRPKNIDKTKLEKEELETFSYLAMDLLHVGLTETSIHLAMVNSKYAGVFMTAENCSQVTSSVKLAIAIRVTMRKNSRLVFRAEEQIKQERKK